MTLLPNKHIPTSRSLIGIGALVLRQLEAPSTVSSLWDQMKVKPELGSFHNFVLVLDYLYAIGAINYDRGFLNRSRR